MNGALPHYPDYRPSDIDWVDAVPKHWKTPLNQRIFRETTRPYEGSSEIQLSLSQRQGLVPTSAMEERSLQTSSFDKWKVVLPGDIVVNRFKGHLGVFFAATLRGITTFHYGVFRPLVRLEPKYFELLFHTPHYCAIFGSRSNGMTVGLQNLSNQNFYNVRAIVPPPDEQAAIVKFLDHADRRIRRYIRAKQKLIKLLEEQKQAIIHRAVTRGLDPNVRLKPLGALLLDELPKHWPIFRAKVLFRQVVPEIPEHAEIVTCFRDGQVTLRRNRRTTGFTNAIKELGYQGIRPGQLVVHSMDAFAGAIGVSDSAGKCSPEYVICEAADSSISLEYYAHLLRSLALRGLFVVTCSAVRERAPRVRFSHFSDLWLPKPPLDEQRAIMTHVEDKIRKLAIALERTRREVDLVSEYRTRLIADVVTGKLDVRAAAAALPDAPPDEPDDLLDESETPDAPDEDDDA